VIYELYGPNVFWVTRIYRL